MLFSGIIKKGLDYAKKVNASGFFNGVKRISLIGRQVAEVSKSILRILKIIPKIPQDKIDKAEAIVNGGEKVLNGIESAGVLGSQLNNFRNHKEFMKDDTVVNLSDKFRREAEERIAIDTANNMKML